MYGQFLFNAGKARNAAKLREALEASCRLSDDDPACQAAQGILEQL